MFSRVACFASCAFEPLVLIEDGEVSGSGSACLKGANFTARRLNLHSSGGDLIKPDGNVTVEDCWGHHFGLNDGAHGDAVQIRNGSNYVFRGNNFNLPVGEPGTHHNSAFIIGSALTPIDNVVIEGNWLNGGNYTVYILDAGNGPPTNVRVTDNRFGRGYRYGLFQFDGPVTRSGNVWDDTGLPV